MPFLPQQILIRAKSGNKDVNHEIGQNKNILLKLLKIMGFQGRNRNNVSLAMDYLLYRVNVISSCTFSHFLIRCSINTVAEKEREKRMFPFTESAVAFEINLVLACPGSL